jgi:D-3-phosphoglycerate dehydrogenase
LRTLSVGDHFVGADVFLEAIHKTLGKDFGPVRTVTWAGASMEEQHAEQQVMEWKGPEAVRTPIEVIQAAGDAEITAVHFAPVPIAVLDAAKDLKAVVVARTGVESAAICAGVGAGTYNSVAEGADRTVHVLRTFEPDQARRDRLEAGNQRYHKVIEALRPFWTRDGGEG